MLVLAGAFGLVSAVAGVAASAVVPGLATGPMVVLASAALFAVSLVCAPSRGLLAMALRPRMPLAPPERSGP
jgi:manganese/zinc/iron transport system permease protein